MSLAAVAADASDGTAPRKALPATTVPAPRPAFLRNAARVPGSTVAAASWIAPSRSTSSSFQRSDMMQTPFSGGVVGVGGRAAAGSRGIRPGSVSGSQTLFELLFAEVDGEPADEQRADDRDRGIRAVLRDC